ncbi:hypothetical protein B0H34DRAFT_708115 [Crassisporium funariophilum]|nr:hypothetical protein B0H34DRAFT_708115 [Crassisporium funariophilum]
MSQDDLSIILSITTSLESTNSLPTLSTSSSLKRRASPSFECSEDNSRKRFKEEPEDMTHRKEMSNSECNTDFMDDLAQELQCGCCSELVYKPVIVMPCQHFFCGSCCVLWIRNGGTNCPACRGLSTIAMPFRALQSVIDTLLRAAPHRSRTERERQQADEIYKSGHSLRLPPPREASPPPEVNRSTEYVHPCPHCLAGNPYDWRCPQPISDPNTDVDHAWHVDDGLPPGHAHCGNCENLLALRAPTTTRCDLCLVSFCGIGVQDRCIAASILSQHPHGMSSHADMIQSADVYECFDGNTVEVEIMLEYLETQRLTPRHMYREIVQYIQKQPRGFATLIELDLFSDIHGVTPGTEPNPEAPRNRICRLCAAEVLLWGLKDWWIRERQKGFLEEAVTNRKDCPQGITCTRQKEDHAHAREFNHIIGRPTPEAGAAENIAPGIPATQQDHSNPNPNNSTLPLAGSSASSLSFLLNVDQDIGISSPPEFRSPTPDVRDVIDRLAA